MLALAPLILRRGLHQLAGLDPPVVAETFGGDVMSVRVSATTGLGFDELEEALLLQARATCCQPRHLKLRKHFEDVALRVQSELMELRCDPDKPAQVARLVPSLRLHYRADRITLDFVLGGSDRSQTRPWTGARGKVRPWVKLYT
jgi:hypothetical protein